VLGVQDTPAGRIGLHVCYDIFFPEVARSQALLGADYLVNVAAAGEGFEAYWDHLTWARATENGSWYLLCSVVGDTRVRGYFGGTRAVAPDGEVVARAADRAEEILFVDLDLARGRRFRSQIHVFETRQPALYAPITLDDRCT
jgi:predicted amidohydrolase